MTPGPHVASDFRINTFMRKQGLMPVTKNLIAHGIRKYPGKMFP